MNRLPYIVEIIGPAGSGKSTLAHALIEQSLGARLGERPQWGNVANLGFYLGNSLRLMPVFMRRPWRGRWYTRDEAQRLFYLAGMSRRLQHISPQPDVLILDQGPVFDMTQLSEFGPERLQHANFTRWWRAILGRWAEALNMVVWLDAADDVLIPRVLARDKWHVIKGYADDEAYEFLHRYRSAFDITMFRLTTSSPICVLEFRTDRIALPDMVQQIASTIARQMTEHHDPTMQYLFA